MNTIYDNVKKLAKHLKRNPIDWNAFDEELSNIDDINIVDEEYDETILSELIAEHCFYHNGTLLTDVIKHFLAKGYDVLAHEGSNGEIVLSQLCWSSYDKHIIDAAKILLAECKKHDSDDSIIENIISGLIGSLEWKLPGVWVVDKNYDLANSYEAFYEVAQAFEKGNDYQSICSFHQCINKTISKVEIVDGLSNLKQKNNINEFCKKIILWFDEIPLVVSPYIIFIINPAFAKENMNKLLNISYLFDKIIGSKLIDIKFIDQTTCYLDFDNGYRLLFSNYATKGRNRNGLFEFRPIKENAFENLKIKEIFRAKGKTYASHVVTYEEESLILSCKDGYYCMFPTKSNNKIYGIGLIDCSEDIIEDYARKFPLTNISDVCEFKKGKNIVGLRIKCDEGWLYVKTNEFYQLEIMLSKEEFNPNDYLSLVARNETGVHMDFPRKKKSV